MRWNGLRFDKNNYNALLFSLEEILSRSNRRKRNNAQDLNPSSFRWRFAPRELGCITEHWSSRPGRPSASLQKSVYAQTYGAGPQLSATLGATIATMRRREFLVQLRKDLVPKLREDGFRGSLPTLRWYASPLVLRSKPEKSGPVARGPYSEYG